VPTKAVDEICGAREMRERDVEVDQVHYNNINYLSVLSYP
jgi:hypothetical protein